MLLHMKIGGKKNSTPYCLARYNAVRAMYSLYCARYVVEDGRRLTKNLMCGGHMSARREAAGMFWDIRKICMLTVV